MQSDDGFDIDTRRRQAIILNFGYWVMLFLLLSLRSRLSGIDQTFAMLSIRLINVGVGMMICLLIWYLMERLERWSFWQRALLGGSLTMVGAFVFALSSNYSPLLFMTREAAAAIDATFIQAVPAGGRFMSLRRIGLEAIEWLPLFFTWGGLAFGLLYSFEVQDRERQVQHLNTLSHQAQLRAMRYQVDPHFLFNTLNSISAVVLDRKNEVAENMLLRLSSFFRRTLALDPTEDITLGSEIEFQQQYIAVEQLRLGSRLQVELDVPEVLASALVPSFILQPLVENAIKHGTPGDPSRSMCVRIEARAEVEWLSLTVSNDGAADRTGRSTITGQSTGTGLRNVRERLRLRFGDRHSFSADRREDGFVARLVLPLEFERPASLTA